MTPQIPDVAQAVPNVVVTPQEEHAYGFIIEVLTKGLYPYKFHVVREYVQNSFDAILRWRQASRQPGVGAIQIKIDPPSLFIYDDGTGMEQEKVKQYRYVGYSEKRTGESVGFRGIGKLSGISVAQKLIVTTSPYGVPQRYQLVFDAEAMLATILALKETGQNIALNELIGRHSKIVTENEDPEQHYTFVELHNMRPDSLALMDRDNLVAYLSMNAPIEFDPGFEHGATIDAWLREHVKDYDTVPITVDGKPVYKPFLSDCKPPQSIMVLDEPAETNSSFVKSEEPNEGEEVGADLLAFCWYCEHAGKGQFEDRERRGLFYRLKNFAVGDNQLPRITLWKSSPERAFYFFGEVHVCDLQVTPSSDRANFEQNDARERLYRRGRQISNSLNRFAGTSSDTRRAKDFIEAAEQLVQTTEKELNDRQVPREMQIPKVVALSNAIQQAEQRLPKAPDDYQDRGKRVIGKGKRLLERLTQPDKIEEQRQGFYDIKEVLGLSPDAGKMYDIIVDVLKAELSDRPAEYEAILRSIHKALEDNWRRVSA